MKRDLDENPEIRDLYAEAGLALYFAQVLEHGIINILVLGHAMAVKKTVRRPITQENISRYLGKAQEIEQRHYKQTLGVLLISLRKSGVPLPDPLVSLLTTALAHRNRLAHRFFRERALELGNSPGRQSLLVELKDIQKVFTEAA